MNDIIRARRIQNQNNTMKVEISSLTSDEITDSELIFCNKS